MNTFTAAIIGVGKAKPAGDKREGHRVGYSHAKVYQNIPRTKLAAGADINAENLQAFRQTFGVEHGFADYREMLAKAKPNLVSICTYVGLHRQMIEDCARAGVRGILCEKPFLASPADIEAVRRVAAETGVKIMVAHFRRNLAAFQRARDLYNDGTVGQPLMCIAGIEGWDLFEWGSHWLDMIRHLHQDRPVHWVFAQTRVRGQRGYGHAMEDHGCAYFEFAGGGKAILDGGRSMNGEELMTLVGTEGTIRIFDEIKLWIETAAGRRIEEFSKGPPDPWGQAWDQMILDLIAWIERGPEPALGLTNMLKTSELNLAAYLSAIKGDRVDLPLSGDDLKLAEWPVEILARRK